MCVLESMLPTRVGIEPVSIAIIPVLRVPVCHTGIIGILEYFNSMLPTHTVLVLLWHTGTRV